MATQTLLVPSATTYDATARVEADATWNRAQQDRVDSTGRKHRMGKQEPTSEVVDSMIKSRVSTRATVMTPTPSVSLTTMPGTTVTQTATQWVTVTVPVPPFATTTPLSARESYPNTRFGLEVSGFAVAAGMLAVGLTQLWRALRR